jgi:hypothetical protein
VVTSVAQVIVGVFALFDTLTPLDRKQLGGGLAVAIFLRRHHHPGGRAALGDGVAG